MTVTTNPIVTGVPVAANVTNPRVSTNATVTGVPDVTDGEISNTVQTNPSVSGKFELDTLLRSFDAPLQTSLVPSRTIGYSTPTFTRATTAYQTDFEGKQNLVPSGAARMQGARPVFNEIAGSSEDLTNGSWTTNGSLVATATTLKFTSSTADQVTNIGHTGAVGAGTWLARVLISVASGTKTFRLRITQSGIADHDSGDFTATTTPKIFTYSTAVSAGGTAIKFTIRQGTTASAGTLNVNQSQLENVTGQTNQNPSEYVSVGVLAAPYHGAGVDGVKYFSTLNGNTVASNVVTEATGAAINSSEAACAGGVTAGVVDASGPLGYLAEGARTNAILQSNTLGTTWTISNAADMEAVAADAYVSTDGTTTMDKLQPKATTAVHSLDQAFTFTAAKYTFALDLRYVPATPQRWVALILNDGTTTWGASFDLLNGVVGAVSAGATSTIEATALANVYRVSVTNTANAAAAAGTVKISLNATDTATLESAARAGTETLGAGKVQLEIGTFASTPITTTTVAVARNASVDQYVSAGNISATATSITMQVTPSVALGSTTVFHWASYVDASNYTAILSDGTNLIARKRIGGSNHDATIAWTRTAGTVAKVGARFDTTNGVDVFLNGTKGTADTTTTASQMGAAHQVGTDGNGANQDYCEHRFFNAYPTALSAARLQAMTA